MASFVPVSADSPFPLQNLPYGVFSERLFAGDAVRRVARVGIAIGDFVFDVAHLDLFPVLAAFDSSNAILCALKQPELNAFMELGSGAWRTLRSHVIKLLSADCPLLRDDARARERLLLPTAADAICMHMPARVGDYTDFYASREHATNVGTMFRGVANALSVNWLHIPIGYHGRASSIGVTGGLVRRPLGQCAPAATGGPGPSGQPGFGPSKRLDFELEMALLVGGKENELGTPLSFADARERAFGLVLMNDWSARDIQAWEYVPLGPFLGKSFATTISAWVVPMSALEPFLVPGPKQDPEPLPYLRDASLKANYDINLQVEIKPSGKNESKVVCRSNAKFLYWSFYQQFVHHSINGCNLRSGDLLGSGTISGPSKDAFGSMLELSWNGKDPVDVGSGETRMFINDGDTVKLSGWCQGDGFRIGFGDCMATVVPGSNLFSV